MLQKLISCSHVWLDQHLFVKRADQISGLGFTGRLHMNWLWKKEHSMNQRTPSTCWKRLLCIVTDLSAPHKSIKLYMQTIQENFWPLHRHTSAHANVLVWLYNAHMYFLHSESWSPHPLPHPQFSPLYMPLRKAVKPTKSSCCSDLVNERNNLLPAVIVSQLSCIQRVLQNTTKQ